MNSTPQEVLTIAGWLSLPVILLRVFYQVAGAWVARSSADFRHESLLSLALAGGALALGCILSPLFSVDRDESNEQRRKANGRIALGGFLYGLFYGFFWVFALYKANPQFAREAGMAWMVVAFGYLAGFPIFYTFWPFVSWQWRRFWKPPRS